MATSRRRFPPSSPGNDGATVIMYGEAFGGLIGYAIDAEGGWMIGGACAVVDDALAVVDARVRQWGPSVALTPPIMGLSDPRLGGQPERPAPRRVPSGIWRTWTIPKIEQEVLAALRRLDVQESANDRERQRMIALYESVHGPLSPDLDADRWRSRHVLREVKRVGMKRGREGYPKEFYLAVATECVRLNGQIIDLPQHDRTVSDEDGGVRKAIAVWAHRSGWTKEQARSATARSWIREARKRGYLSKPTTGRFTAYPGPNYEA